MRKISSSILLTTTLIVLLQQDFAAAQDATAQLPRLETKSELKSVTIDVDLNALIKTFAEYSKQNFIFDERVKGRITFTWSGEIKASDFSNIVDTALSIKGFTAVVAGKNIWKIVPLAEAGKQGVSLKAINSGQDNQSLDKDRIIDLRAALNAASPVRPSSPPRSSEAAVAIPTEFSVDKKLLSENLKNMPHLLTQARAVPYFQNGQSVGFRLFAIKAGSLYEQVGLRNGDIIKTVNGQSMSDPSEALRLFETLAEVKSVTVVLERQKEDLELKYKVH